MRRSFVTSVAVVLLTSACATPPQQKSQPEPVAAAPVEAPVEAPVQMAGGPNCEMLAVAMETAEAERVTAENVRGAGSAVSTAASVFSFVPGLGLAMLAVKGAAKVAKLAGEDAQRAPAEPHAESLAQWEEMGCEGEA